MCVRGISAHMRDPDTCGDHAYTCVECVGGDARRAYSGHGRAAGSSILRCTGARHVPCARCCDGWQAGGSICRNGLLLASTCVWSGGESVRRLWPCYTQTSLSVIAMWHFSRASPAPACLRLACDHTSPPSMCLTFRLLRPPSTCPSRSQGTMNFNRNGMGGGGFQGGGGFNRGGFASGGALPDNGVKPYNYRTKPCRYFQMGNCKNGDRCTFLHTTDDAGSGGGGGGGGGYQPNGGMGGGMMNGGGMGMGNMYGGGMQQQQQRW